MTLKTEIPFNADLFDESSSAYTTKRAEILDELTPTFDTISDTTGAEYTAEDIGVVFTAAR